MSVLRNFLVAVFLIAGVAAAPDPAKAEFSVCNYSYSDAFVSIGYPRDGSWTSEGWWRVSPMRCAPILKGRLTSRHYYLRVSNETRVWAGDYKLCYASARFRADGFRNCERRGYQTAGFMKVDTQGAPAFKYWLYPDHR